MTYKCPSCQLVGILPITGNCPEHNVSEQGFKTVENNKTPVYGHVSEETAYLIADYPYGFKLRCQMKVWLEYKEGKGYRMVTKTSNPKKPGMWNKEKCSTYCSLGGCLYLDSENHIQWAGVSLYSSFEQLKAFAEEYPGADLGMVNAIINHHSKKSGN